MSVDAKFLKISHFHLAHVKLEKEVQVYKAIFCNLGDIVILLKLAQYIYTCHKILKTQFFIPP